MDNTGRLVFSADLPLVMRPEIEALFFFNPRQPFRREGIHAAIAHAGMPEIAENGDKVWIDLPSGTTQCLFACDKGLESLKAVGVVLYSRPTFNTIAITHVAVDPDYAYGGEHANLNVLTRLLERVVATASSIKGVTRIQLPYRNGRCLRVTTRESARRDEP